LLLTSTARTAGRAFDAALAAAGGSLPVWLVLLAIQTGPIANQRELAAAVGIRGATLSHHLDAMESDGLVTRRHAAGDRRTHRVELTERGEAAFHRLRAVAVAQDRRLRADLDDHEIELLRGILARMVINVSGPGAPVER
jgi:MarR family transcriptional regulator for hemolysin